MYDMFHQLLPVQWHMCSLMPKRTIHITSIIQYYMLGMPIPMHILHEFLHLLSIMFIILLLQIPAYCIYHIHLLVGLPYWVLL